MLVNSKFLFFTNPKLWFKVMSSVQGDVTTYSKKLLEYGIYSASSLKRFAASYRTIVLDGPRSNRATSPAQSPFNYHYTVRTPLCLKTRPEAVHRLTKTKLAHLLSAAVFFMLTGLALAQTSEPAAAAQSAKLTGSPAAFHPEALTPGEGFLRQGTMGDKVAVEGRAEDNQAGHQVMALDFSGQVFTGLSGPRGEFLLEGIPAGSYTLIASSPGFLSATCTPVTHTGGNLRLNDVILLAGDLDSSGEIDMVDVVRLGAAFGQSGPAEGADLNADSRVDILDLILLAANHGQTAIANPWLCQ